MKKDLLLFINDMLEAITLVEQYIPGLSEEEFSRDTEKQDSVIHNL